MLQVLYWTKYKTLEIRTKQHKANVKRANENSGIYQLVKNEGHIIKWEEGIILFNFKKFDIRTILVSMIIKNIFNNNMNLNTGIFNMNNNIKREICKAFEIG